MDIQKGANVLQKLKIKSTDVSYLASFSLRWSSSSFSFSFCRRSNFRFPCVSDNSTCHHDNRLGTNYNNLVCTTCYEFFKLNAAEVFHFSSLSSRIWKVSCVNFCAKFVVILHAPGKLFSWSLFRKCRCPLILYKLFDAKSLKH